MKLTNDEKIMVFDMGENEVEHIDRQAQNSLVCKLLTEKNIKGEVFRTMMPRIWANVSVKSEIVERNIYLCKFKSQRDKNKIINNSPWFFYKPLLLMEI